MIESRARYSLRVGASEYSVPNVGRLERKSMVLNPQVLGIGAADLRFPCVLENIHHSGTEFR